VPQVHPLALLHPRIPLLAAALHWRRRVWRIRNPFTRDLLVDVLIHERLRDGLALLGTKVWTFARELSIDVGGATPLQCAMQYVVYQTQPDLVVSEMWIEPHGGKVVGNSGAVVIFDSERPFFVVVVCTFLTCLIGSMLEEQDISIESRN
jgi:hypothetical protein